jgi:hypothetical protein
MGHQKELDIEAEEQLWHQLKRQPTEDEIRDHRAANEDRIYDLLKERGLIPSQRKYVLNDVSL